jgi:hypothetical protein
LKTQGPGGSFDFFLKNLKIYFNSSKVYFLFVLIAFLKQFFKEIFGMMGGGGDGPFMPFPMWPVCAKHHCKT